MDVCVVETNLNLNFGNIKKRERNALIALMEEFRDCVSSSMKDLGRTNITEIEIKCFTEEPVAYQPYRLSESEKEIVRKNY